MEPISGILVEAEQQYGFITEGSRGGIWAWDVLSDRVYLNNQLLDILGVPSSDISLRSQDIFNLLSPTDQDILKRDILNLQKKTSFNLTVTTCSKEDVSKHIYIKGKAYKDKQEQLIRISGVAYDVTEEEQLKETSKSLKKELTDIRHALDESTIVAITDWHGVIIYANEAFCKISQYSQHELIGKTHRIINSGYHPKSFFTKMWDTISSGRIWKGEIKNKAKDGTYYWVDTTIVPFLDESLKPLQYIAIRHDITRLKNAEEEIHALNESLEKRVEDRTTQLQQINLSLNKEISERERAELELRNNLKREKLIRHILQVVDHSYDIDFILRMVAQEIGIYFDVDRCLITYYEKEDNRVKYLSLAAQYCALNIGPVQEDEIPQVRLNCEGIPLVHEQHPLVLLEVSQTEDFPDNLEGYIKKYFIQSALIMEIRYKDISFGRISLHQCRYVRTWNEENIDLLETLIFQIGASLYQAELYQHELEAQKKAKQASQEKTKILSYVSHDFKNPLDSITRFIDILNKNTDEPLTEKQIEILGYIDEGVYQLRNMVTVILDKARLEEGLLTPSVTRLELKPFMDNLSPLFNTLASQGNVSFKIEIQPEISIIKTDPTYLRQIFVNLFSNAVKYNRTGGTVSIRIYKENGSLCIEIRDTGIGIAPNELENIFKEYYRTNFQKADLVEGSGLGLPFIKKLVELSGGNISVKSQVGVGTTFTVTLPQ